MPESDLTERLGSLNAEWFQKGSEMHRTIAEAIWVIERQRETIANAQRTTDLMQGTIEMLRDIGEGMDRMPYRDSGDQKLGL